MHYRIILLENGKRRRFLSNLTRAFWKRAKAAPSISKRSEKKNTQAQHWKIIAKAPCAARPKRLLR